MSFLQEQSNPEGLSPYSSSGGSDVDRPTVSRLLSDFTDLVSDCVFTVTNHSKLYLGALESFIRSSDEECKHDGNHANMSEIHYDSTCEFQRDATKLLPVTEWTITETKEANNNEVPSEAKGLYTFNAFQKAKYIPFCEEYDGRPVRKGHTISACIKDLIESRIREEEQTSSTNRFVCSKSLDEMAKYQTSTERLENRSWTFSAHSTCNSRGRPSIIPEMENDCVKSPHLNKRFNAKRKTSVLENDYITMKKELTSPEICKKSKYGTIQISIQYLLMTNRLKVVINSVRGILEEELKQTNYTKTYVKVCIMPRKGKTQLKTMKVRSSNEIRFDTELYFKEIDFASVHLLALRFQVWQLSGRIFPHRRCVGETLVWLDEVNVMNNVELVENLRPYV